MWIVLRHFKLIPLVLVTFRVLQSGQEFKDNVADRSDNSLKLFPTKEPSLVVYRL